MNAHSEDKQYLRDFDTADFSAADYDAIPRNGRTAAQEAFVIVPTEEVTLRVLTQAGTDVVATFTPGGVDNLVLIKRIFFDAGNSVTSVKVAY